MGTWFQKVKNKAPKEVDEMSVDELAGVVP
jgi:hypothetical protein